MNDGKVNAQDAMPVMDDGWWESVLAEERFVVPRTQADLSAEAAPRPESKVVEPPKPQVDWAKVELLYAQDQIVMLQVTGSNRGGLLVEGDGIAGFVPFSHLVEAPAGGEDSDREKFMTARLGRALQLKVIECSAEAGRAVFSERAALAGPGKRSEIFQSLHVGERVSGQVTNITEFGVFVDLGGVEGLIHISELSWGRVAHPGQIVHLNQKVDVQILELSAERCRVALSLKRLLPNPWLTIESDISAGKIVPARITSVLSFGAFARLASGVEGLVHASEIPGSPEQPVRELLREGQDVQVRILHIDAAHQRMGLSMRL